VLLSIHAAGTVKRTRLCGRGFAGCAAAIRRLSHVVRYARLTTHSQGSSNRSVRTKQPEV
jgi:hypothetical protein